jgi:MoxR-like ATPase
MMGNLTKINNIDIPEFSDRVINNLEKVIVGKRASLELTLLTLLCEGHMLIEDIPGVGKTMLARSLAISLGCDFSRIQFTPDMLPSDVTGVSIYNQKKQTFEFRPGPIISNIVLADEINRATPKTQSALLEAMEEKQVTVDGTTHRLERPFMVMATQNPIEYEGTYPLPEAQMDRFFMKVSLGYPHLLDEILIIKGQQLQHPIELITAVTNQEEIISACLAVKQIHVSAAIEKYIVLLVRETRHHESVYLGASPRGSISLYKAGQALASIQGRDFVLPDDIKKAAEPVLSHRLVIKPSARLHNHTPAQVIKEVLDSVEIPLRQD